MFSHSHTLLFFAYFLLHGPEQIRANPVLVPRGLPTAEEYQAMEWFQEGGASLVVAPAQTRDEEEREGYLAVIEKA